MAQGREIVQRSQIGDTIPISEFPDECGDMQKRGMVMTPGRNRGSGGAAASMMANALAGQ